MFGRLGSHLFRTWQRASWRASCKAEPRHDWNSILHDWTRSVCPQFVAIDNCFEKAHGRWTENLRSRRVRKKEIHVHWPQTARNVVADFVHAPQLRGRLSRDCTFRGTKGHAYPPLSFLWRAALAHLFRFCLRCCRRGHESDERVLRWYSVLPWPFSRLRAHAVPGNHDVWASRPVVCSEHVDHGAGKKLIVVTCWQFVNAFFWQVNSFILPLRAITCGPSTLVSYHLKFTKFIVFQNKWNWNHLSCSLPPPCSGQKCLSANTIAASGCTSGSWPLTKHAWRTDTRDKVPLDTKV